MRRNSIIKKIMLDRRGRISYAVEKKKGIFTSLWASLWPMRLKQYKHRNIKKWRLTSSNPCESTTISIQEMQCKL
jgi:hypothetical protein